MDHRPSTAEILANPVVRAHLRQAFMESDVGGSQPVEQGGFIVRDSHSGQLDVARVPQGEQDQLLFPLCKDGTYNGKEIVGSFHTHPNTGEEWTQEPSRQDVQMSQEYPETMGAHQFILSARLVYHIDNEGVVTEMGPTSELLRTGGRGSAL